MTYQPIFYRYSSPGSSETSSTCTPYDNFDRASYQSHLSSRSSCFSSSTSISSQSSRKSHYLNDFVQDIADGCTFFLVNTFFVSTSPEPQLAHIQPHLPEFIADIITSTNLHPLLIYAALTLLQRLRARLPRYATGFSGHRLFLAASLVVQKDSSFKLRAFDDAYWSKLSSFSTKEVREMEEQLWNELDGNVTVYPSNGCLQDRLTWPLEKMKQPPAAPMWVLENDSVGEFDLDAVNPSSSTAYSANPPIHITGQTLPRHPSCPLPRKTRSLRSRFASLFRRNTKLF